MATDFEEGLLVGILVGEGHFGGDGRQPHVTLRMHERHSPLFRWIERTFPGGRVYGPYDHGGRRYYQWMARGVFLRQVLAPILDRRLTPEIDAYGHERYTNMRRQYQRQLSSTEEPASSPSKAGSGLDPAVSQGTPSDRAPRRQPGQLSKESDPVGRIFAGLHRQRDRGSTSDS